MDVRDKRAAADDSIVQCSESLRKSLQNVSARSNALHRAVSMLGPLQLRSTRYDVLPRTGSLSSIRRRRAKVRKVRSPSFRDRSGPQPLVVCTSTSTWSLSSPAANGGTDGSRLSARRRRTKAYSPGCESSVFDYDVESASRQPSLKRDRLSDSFLSLRSLDNAVLNTTCYQPLRRSETVKSRLLVHRSLSTSGWHKDLVHSQSVPFSERAASQRKLGSTRVPSRRTLKASQSLVANGMDGGGGGRPNQGRSLSPGMAIWDQVIAKHWNTLVAHLKPQACQDLLYQYDVVTWQQYRTIQDAADERDAASHLLHALRSGPPDAVATFVELLGKVKGQENLAYMLHQEMTGVPKENIDGAAEEAKTYVSPQHTSGALQAHRAAVQPWNMLDASSTGSSGTTTVMSPPPTQPPPHVFSTASPPPTSLEHHATRSHTQSSNQRVVLGDVHVTNDQYSVVSKPLKTTTTTTSSTQVTSDEGFVEQNSDNETPPPVPPHPVPLPDISQETGMTDSTDRLYAGVPSRAVPPPDPPLHRHTGSSLSHDSSHAALTSPAMSSSPADALSSGAGSLTHSEDAISGGGGGGIGVRAYSLSQPRAYSPRASAQFSEDQPQQQQQHRAADAVALPESRTPPSSSSTEDRSRRRESLHEKRAYSPRSSSTTEVQIIEELDAAVAATSSLPPSSSSQHQQQQRQEQITARERIAAQTSELDRMQSSLMHDLDAMRVESPPGVSKPAISLLPKRRPSEGSASKVLSTRSQSQSLQVNGSKPGPAPLLVVDGSGGPGGAADLRHRPLPKSPEDQSPFRRGTFSGGGDEAGDTPQPLALDSLQRGVEPIGRNSLHLDNQLVRRKQTSTSSANGGGGGHLIAPYDVVGGQAAPYETLSRIRGEANSSGAHANGVDAACPIVISPPYAEAGLLARENNTFAKFSASSISGSVSAQDKATIMEVYPDDTPDDVLGVSVDGNVNGGSFLDAEEPYDLGFIRPPGAAQLPLRKGSSSPDFNRIAGSSQSPSSREWLDDSNVTPAGLSMDSMDDGARPPTPGGASRSSAERNIVGPSTGDDIATPLELWMIAWISEYLYVESDKVDVYLFTAIGLDTGKVADTSLGGKGLSLMHLMFDSLNIRQFKMRRKGILQSLAMGIGMRELKVVCREINHGQSMVMSVWVPDEVRDTVLRLADEKSFVLRSAGVVLVRCTARVVWCTDKKKKQRKKLRLSSKGKSKADPVDLERIELAVDKTACELWLLMEPIENPIHHAVLTGNHILVDTLVSIGVDINAPNKGGETPLHLASQIGHVEVVQLLTDTGATVSALNSSGMTPLHWAANQGNSQVVQVLLRAGADPNATEQRHQATPLHAAAVMGRPDVIQVLLDNGANVKAIDQDGHTACHLAVLFAPVQIEEDDLPDDYADILDILLCSGAQPTPRSHEWITPLHIASSNGLERLINVLLHYHADINAVDQRHWQTPLHFAAAAGKLAVVDTLVSSGADVAAIDKGGLTAADVAATAEVRTYLEERLQNLPEDLTVVADVSEEDMLVTDV